jgi:hypothetical protein
VGRDLARSTNILTFQKAVPMEQVDVSHREIYDRLLAVEHKVDRIDKATADVVAAFNAAQGAFTVLEWLGKLAKPILWVGGVITAVGIIWQNFRVK